MLNVFLDEMRAGLAGSDSTIKMLPSYVTRMPNGSEKGVVRIPPRGRMTHGVSYTHHTYFPDSFPIPLALYPIHTRVPYPITAADPPYVTVSTRSMTPPQFWAIDVGGTNLRVVSVELDGASGLTIKNEIAAPVPRELRHGRAVDLFTHIATTLKSAGAKGGDKVGFTFSFPIQSTAVDSATLIEWTKEYVIEDCIVWNIRRSSLGQLSLLYVEAGITSAVCCVAAAGPQRVWRDKTSWKCCVWPVTGWGWM